MPLEWSELLSSEERDGAGHSAEPLCEASGGG